LLLPTAYVAYPELVLQPLIVISGRGGPATLGGHRVILVRCVDI
jgi:hypothetical protein